jgi:hypothetical protein
MAGAALSCRDEEMGRWGGRVLFCMRESMQSALSLYVLALYSFLLLNLAICNYDRVLITAYIQVSE